VEETLSNCIMDSTSPKCYIKPSGVSTKREINTILGATEELI